MTLHFFIAVNAKIAVSRDLKPCTVRYLFLFQVCDSIGKVAQSRWEMNEWVWSIGGKMMTRESRNTGKKSSLNANLSSKNLTYTGLPPKTLFHRRKAEQYEHLRANKHEDKRFLWIFAILQICGEFLVMYNFMPVRVNANIWGSQCYDYGL